MAKIVYAAGVSHSPLLTLDPGDWARRSEADFSNPRLNTSGGRWLTYEQLEAEVGTIHATDARFDVYLAKNEGSQLALDRVAADLAAASPDVVIIVGDDQRELFCDGNQPAFAIFHGDAVATSSGFWAQEKMPDWVNTLAVGYAMDESHSFPGAPELALHLIEELMERDFDMGAVARVEDPTKAGFGHAFGFIVKRLFGGRSIPILPVLVNTYYPPNVPSAARCYSLGQAMKEAITTGPSDLRVAVIASGGLSHFVVDEALDRTVLDAISSGDHAALLRMPRAALNSGSSEILNWITVAGVVEGHRPSWSDYYPTYRTPAGTGVGLGFISWNIIE